MIENKLHKNLVVASRSLLSNLLVFGISACLIFWSYRLLQNKMTTVNSLDAVINGLLIDIKAPGEGTVSQLELKTGDDIIRHKNFITLNNDRVSQLQSQEINSRLNLQKAQLLQEKAQLNQQLTLLDKLKADRQNQQHLEVLEIQKSIEEIIADIKAAQARYQIAQLNHKRTAFLKTEGAVSQASLDIATAQMEQRQAEISSLEARTNALRAQQQAAKLGLTLSKSRSNFDPRIRLEELQMQISNQRQVIQGIEQNIKSRQAELVQANEDLKRKQTVAVSAPISGVVWRLYAQEGKFVQQGESLGQILDCSRRWVDVFVDERAVKSIQPGTPATVELYGSTSPILHGQVSMIRSGLGRLTAGEDIAVPIPPNSPRNTQVRVDLDSSTEPGSSGFFCYVGYTGKVTFKVK